MKNIVLLGSTGSVGRNVLEVVRKYPDKFRVKAISSYSNYTLLREQAEEFRPEEICLGNKDLYKHLKDVIPSDIKFTSGKEELERLAKEGSDELVFIAISGIAALKPLIAALEAGKMVALASKEPIVSAGMIIKKIIDGNSSKILPVDSEHSAVMQCLAGRKNEEIRTLYITGSGGSLKDEPFKNFKSLSVEKVLDHPKWDMGPKITVDSATLMNKGLEMIEARWIFDVAPDRIKVVIHPEAIIHSMVEFIDGTINANLFYPDMKFPILRALSYPEVFKSDFPRVNFFDIKNFTFQKPNAEKFPALELAYRALEVGGTMPAALNASNETAVRLFLEKKIRFTDIINVVKKIMDIHKTIVTPSLEDIVNSEKWAGEEVLRFC